MKKYYVIIFIALVSAIMASPIMNVKNIKIEGNNKFANGEILEMAGYSEEANIFAFSSSKASQSLMDNTYISSVSIEKHYFEREIVLTVKERQLCGYVKYNQGNYLYIDKDGIVLECRTSFIDRCPVIEGLEDSEFSVGEPLKVKNKDAFDTMVSLSHLFEKFEIEHDIIRVDLSKPDDIHFFYGKIDILLGDTSELDLKVRTIKEILPTLDDKKDFGGFLYVQNANQARYSILS